MALNAHGFTLGAMIAIRLLTGESAEAVEGGTGAYLLGSRDTLSGIVPPPGTYLSATFDSLSGSVEGISIGGLPIRADASVDVNLIRLGWTQSFDTKIWGGQPAFNLTVPFPWIDLAYTAVTPPLAGSALRDETSGIGDLSFTGLLGWSAGNLHYNTALTVYAPTGAYELATVNVSERSINALSVGKNVWSFQPVFAATWLNPKTGLEFSGAVSLLFSTRNKATDYQTAPALQFEGAIVQRLASGWGFGLSGYAYQQLDDDSGSAAEFTRDFLGSDSLQARVFGAGPMVVFSGGELFGADLSFKAKYTAEFGARRRLESDILTLNMSLAF